MSIDEKAEQALFDAIQNVAALPRPKERERIFRTAVLGIMKSMGWSSLSTERFYGN